MKQMKKNRMLSLLVLISIFTFVLQSCGLFSFYESAKMKDYYEEKENYIEAEGYIESYHYNQERNAYYFVLQPDWLPQEEAGDPNFKVIGKNALILKENNIENKLAPNSFIKFLYAPEYFGDGYIRPIVSLTVDGEELLSFEEGYSNFIESL